MMWLLFAFLSALFAGLTAILAKCGIENMDSNVAIAIRTIVVLIFSWVLVFVMGVQNGFDGSRNVSDDSKEGSRNR